MKYRLRYRKNLRRQGLWKDKSTRMLVLLSVPITLLVGWIYRLGTVYLPFLGIAIAIFLYKIQIEERRKRREKERFEAFADYLQQMLYSFERTRDIQLSLKETAELFTEGQMYDVLSKVLAYLDNAYSADCKRMALGIIEKEFPNEELKLLHEFMLEAEEQGGHIADVVVMLKEEQRRYRLRVNLFQEQCKKQQRNIILACVAGLLLCSSILYLVPDGTMLTGYSLYHIGTVFLVWLNFLIIALGMKVTNRDWLKENRRYTEEEMEEKLLRYLNGKQKIGKRTLKKIIQSELNQVFPGWMLKLSLLLQNRDVAGAVQESAKSAPKVLLFYVRRLMEGIANNPDSPQPYMEFMDEFKTSTSSTFMKMLYTISSGGCSDAPKQLMMLLERNNQLENQETLVKQENALAITQALFLSPTLLASFKMILDMSMLLVSFLSQLGMA